MFARRFSFSLSLCVSVFYGVSSVCSVCLDSSFSFGMRAQTITAPVDQLRALSTTFVKRLNRLCFKFYVRLPVCLSAVCIYIYIYSMYDLYMHVSYVHDFAVLSARSLEMCKCHYNAAVVVSNTNHWK